MFAGAGGTKLDPMLDACLPSPALEVCQRLD
jgi:hypothetical protein